MSCIFEFFVERDCSYILPSGGSSFSFFLTEKELMSGQLTLAWSVILTSWRPRVVRRIQLTSFQNHTRKTTSVFCKSHYRTVPHRSTSKQQETMLYILKPSLKKLSNYQWKSYQNSFTRTQVINVQQPSVVFQIYRVSHFFNDK